MSVEVQPQSPANSRPFYCDILTVPVSIELGDAVAELLAEFPGYTLGVVTGSILRAARSATPDETRCSILNRARLRLRQ